MAHLLLHVGEDLPGIGLIPTPIEVLGGQAELDHEVAPQSSGSISPRFSRRSRRRAGSSLPMMIRASEPPMKYPRPESSGVFNTPDFILHHLIYNRLRGVNTHMG